MRDLACLLVTLFPALLLTPPTSAAPSLCGHLPETGLVARPGVEEQVPARPRADRRLGCPPGFSLDLVARPPACRRPGQRVIDGNPRAACRASLSLGPVADVPAQWRPTRSCPSGSITALVRLEGQNVGLADVTLASRSPGVRVSTIDEDTKDITPDQRPSAQGCLAHACRLVRLDVAADAPMDAARLELAVQGGASVEVLVPLQGHCDDPSARPPGAGMRRIIGASPSR